MSTVIQQAMSWVQAVPNVSAQSTSSPSSSNDGRPHSQQSTHVFHRLPDNVLDLILVYADPETFASLAVLNRQWRSKSSSSLLYAFHLAQIKSVKEGRNHSWEEYKDEEIGKLKSLFAKQISSNFFAAYRPRQSRYKLSSPSSLSSTAAPHGESFSFWASPSGTRMVVSSSTILCIFKPSSHSMVMERSFKIPRRPTSVVIDDDGRILAVLSPEWSLGVYSLADGRVERISSFVLEESGKAIALSPDSAVIVVAEEHGLEILSLVQDSPQAPPRRKVATHEFDHVCFTDGGTTIIASGVKSATNCTTIVTVEEPITEDMGKDTNQEKLAHLWTTQPLFPSTFSQTTHAVPVPGDAERLIAYDIQAKSFGILDTHDVRFIQPLVPAPMDEASFATILPSVDPVNGVLAVAFREAGLYLARLPRHEGKKPEPDFELDVQHQQFSRPFSGLKWITGDGDRLEPTSRSLLAVRSPTSDASEESQSDGPIDSGEVVVLEYAYHASVGPSLESTIELPREPRESLDRADSPSPDQVEETRNQLTSQSSRQAGNPPLARTVTSAGRTRLRRKNSARTGHPTQQVEPLAPEEVHFDEPYTVGQPRPRASLQRAAAAGANRPRSMPLGTNVMRAPGGRGEIPDESDADNWVPPPPQYSKDAEEELPEGLQQTLIPPQRIERSEFTNSSPNLLSGSELPIESASQQQDFPLPVPRQRPRTARPMTAIQNARNSVVGGVQEIRRAFTGPLDNTTAGQQEGAGETYSSAPVSSRSRTMTADFSRVTSWGLNRANDQNPRPASTHIDGALGSRTFPGRSRRKRPQSMFLDSGPQPLDTTKISPISPRPAVGSPALPSPSQIDSLHRRHHSGSISSIRSDSSDIIPRAAIGARRQTIGTSAQHSPWSSQLMLTSVAEADPGEGPSGASNGDAIRPVSQYGTDQRDTVSGAQESLPPSSADEGAKEAKAVQFEASNDEVKDTAGDEPRTSRRLSRHIYGARRLSTIQSMTSLISSARSAISGSEVPENLKTQSSKSRERTQDGHARSNALEGNSGSGVRRNQSRKLQRGNSGKVQRTNSRRVQRGNSNSKLQRGPSTRVQKPTTAGASENKENEILRTSTNAQQPVGNTKKGFRARIKAAVLKNLRSA